MKQNDLQQSLGSPKDIREPQGENATEGTDAGGQEWEEADGEAAIEDHWKPVGSFRKSTVGDTWFPMGPRDVFFFDSFYRRPATTNADKPIATGWQPPKSDPWGPADIQARLWASQDAHIADLMESNALVARLNARMAEMGAQIILLTRDNKALLSQVAVLHNSSPVIDREDGLTNPLDG